MQRQYRYLARIIFRAVLAMHADVRSLYILLNDHSMFTWVHIGCIYYCMVYIIAFSSQFRLVERLPNHTHVRTRTMNQPHSS